MATSIQTSSPFDRFDQTFGILAEARQLAEGDVITAVLAKWPAHVVVAETAGLEPHHFSEPDHLCLWTAIDYGRCAGLVDVLRYARFLLKHEHLWCDAEPARCWRQGRHSDQTLARMALEYPYCADDVRVRVRRLRHIASHGTRLSEIVAGAVRYAEHLNKWVEHNIPDALEPPEYFGEFVLRILEERGIAPELGMVWNYSTAPPTRLKEAAA